LVWESAELMSLDGTGSAIEARDKTSEDGSTIQRGSPLDCTDETTKMPTKSLAFQICRYPGVNSMRMPLRLEQREFACDSVGKDSLPLCHTDEKKAAKN